jgi:hypothetical protein
LDTNAVFGLGLNNCIVRASGRAGVIEMSDLTMPEQQKRAAILPPELQEDKRPGYFRGSEKYANVSGKARPSHTVPHLYERTVELYLDILDMQAQSETTSPGQLRSFLQEAEQVVAGLIRKEAGSI